MRAHREVDLARLRLEAAGHLENRFLNEQHIENVCESVPGDSAFLYSECIFSERYEAVFTLFVIHVTCSYDVA